MDEMVYKPGMGYRDILILAIKREEAALKLYNKLLALRRNPRTPKLYSRSFARRKPSTNWVLETMYDDHMAEMGD